MKFVADEEAREDRYELIVMCLNDAVNSLPSGVSLTEKSSESLVSELSFMFGSESECSSFVNRALARLDEHFGTGLSASISDDAIIEDSACALKMENLLLFDRSEEFSSDSDSDSGSDCVMDICGGNSDSEERFGNDAKFSPTVARKSNGFTFVPISCDGLEPSIDMMRASRKFGGSVTPPPKKINPKKKKISPQVLAKLRAPLGNGGSTRVQGLENRLKQRKRELNHANHANNESKRGLMVKLRCHTKAEPRSTCNHMQHSSCCHNNHNSCVPSNSPLPGPSSTVPGPSYSVPGISYSVPGISSPILATNNAFATTPATAFAPAAATTPAATAAAAPSSSPYGPLVPVQYPALMQNPYLNPFLNQMMMMNMMMMMMGGKGNNYQMPTNGGYKRSLCSKYPNCPFGLGCKYYHPPKGTTSSATNDGAGGPSGYTPGISGFSQHQ